MFELKGQVKLSVFFHESVDLTRPMLFASSVGSSHEYGSGEVINNWKKAPEPSSLFC